MRKNLEEALASFESFWSRSSGSWAYGSLQFQKIGQQLFSGAGENGFRVELNPFDFRFLVTQPHDEPVRRSRGNFKAGGQRRALHNQRMIARGEKGIGKPGKNCLAIVSDRACFAMHDDGRSNHFPAKSLPDGLMAEADSQDRNPFGKFFDQLDANPRFGGSFRAGRNHDAVGRHSLDFIDRRLIVAADLDLCAQLPEVLDQVVGKRIVIVDDEDHVLTRQTKRLNGGWRQLRPRDPVRERIELPIGLGAAISCSYLTDRRLTSKINVAFGGITPAAPLAP